MPWLEVSCYMSFVVSVAPVIALESCFTAIICSKYPTAIWSKWMRISVFYSVLVIFLSHTALAESQKNPMAETEAGRFFVLANVEFTLLHEFGHLLIEEFKLPVFGMEEDAADRIAIIVMMRTRQHESAKEVIPWVFAVAGGWYTEWELKSGPEDTVDYWDNHDLEIQRFHNIVCLIYGGNSELLHDLIDTEMLPFERAMVCEEEYQQALHSVEWLQANYGYKEGETIKADTVKVIYEEPIEGKNQAMFELLQASQVAEKLAARLSSRFHLPRPISIEFDNCVSNPEAYWHAPTGSVTVCYELLEHFFKMAEYRQQHSRRACGIPSLRRYMGERLRCAEVAGEVGKETAVP